MTLTQVQAFYGLRAIATPTGTNISNDVQIGIGNTVQALESDVAYSLRAIFAGSGDILDLNPATNDTTGSTAWVAGTAQVETATAAGTITGSGNATVIVTAAGMTGSPKTISVAVTNGDTAATWAEKVRVALTSDTAVSALFTVGGSTTAITLTRKPTNTYTVGAETVNVYPANDGTLNVSLDNGTCTGITTASTSANTTAGVATDGVKIYDGDGKDFEGATIPTIGSFNGILIKVNNGSLAMTSTGGVECAGLITNSIVINLNQDGTGDSQKTFTASASSDVEIIVIGTAA